MKLVHAKTVEAFKAAQAAAEEAAHQEYGDGHAIELLHIARRLAAIANDTAGDGDKPVLATIPVIVVKA